MFKKTLALVVPFLGYSMESSYQLHHQSLNEMLKDLSPIQIQNNTDHPVQIELFFDKTLKANGQRHEEVAPDPMWLLDINHTYDSFMCPKSEKLVKNYSFFLAKDVNLKGLLSYTIKGGESLGIPIFDGYKLYSIKPNNVNFLNFLNAATMTIDYAAKKFSFDGIVLAQEKDRQLITPHFDEAYYMKNYGDDLNTTAISPIDHFLTVGHKKNYAPNHWFDMGLYKKYFPCEGNAFLEWILKNMGNPKKNALIEAYDQLFSLTDTESNEHLAWYENFLVPFWAFWGMEKEQIEHKRKILLSSAKSLYQLHIFNNEQKHKISKIPHISHHVWITNQDNPCEVPQEKITQLLTDINEVYPKDWSHIFWCQNRDKIPLTISMLSKNLSLTIKSLNDIWPFFRGKEIYDKLYRKKFFTSCSDLVRFNIIFLMGGLYSDFGVEFSKYFFEIMDDYMIVTSREGFMWGGTTFFGCEKKSLILNEMLNVIEHLDSLPNHLQNFFNYSPLPVYTSIPMFTLMIDKYTNEENYILPISSGKLVKRNHMASWLKGLYGQTKITKDTWEKTDFFSNAAVVPEFKLDLALDGFTKFTIAISEKMYARSIENLKKKRIELTNHSKNTYHKILLNKGMYVIPHITHRSWITSQDNPREAPIEKLDLYLESTRSFTSHSDWRHIFWCLDKKKIPLTIAYLEQANLDIEIKEISDIYQKMKGREIFDEFLNDSRFCNANDIFRMNMLFLYGGFYSDLGMLFKKDMTPIIDNFNLVTFMYPHQGSLDHGIFACPKNFKIPLIYLNTLSKIFLLPKDIQDLTRNIDGTQNPDYQLIWTGSHHLMSIMDCYLDDQDKVFFMKPGVLFDYNSLGSWKISKDNFGNKGILQSKLNVFNIHTYPHITEKK